MMDALLRALRRTIERARSVVHLLVLRIQHANRVAIGDGVFLGFGSRICLTGDGRLALGDGVRLIRTTITVGQSSNASIGGQSHVSGLDLRVSDAGQAAFGAGCRINTLVPGARTVFIVRGGDATVGDAVFIDGGSYRALDAGRLQIGDHASLGIDSEVRAEVSVRIGAYTMVAYRVSVFDTNTHSLDYRDRRKEVERYPAYERGTVDRAAVEIGNDCWLGLGCAVLKGARIGDRSIVGMNTTVTAGTYPADSTIVGGAAQVRTRSASGATTK